MKENLNSAMRGVTLRQLRVLSAVVRRGTQSAAADALGVTPPAVALQLRQLEETLRVALVERAAEGLRPTDAGREVLATADRIEAALLDCGQAIEALRGMDGGRVAVGVISTAKYFAPRALAAYNRVHPKVEMRVLVGNRKDMIAALERFDLDLALMGRPPETFEIERAVVGENPHVVIAPPDHPLVGLTGLPLARLAGERFLLREPGSGTRILLDRLLAEAGVSPSAGMEVGSNETIKQAVMAGLGIAFISAHTTAAELTEGRLVALDVEGLPVLRHWFGVRRADKTLMPAVHAFCEFLQTEGASFLPVIAT